MISESACLRCREEAGNRAGIGGVIMRFTIAPVTAVSIIAFTQIASAATPENRPVRRAPPPQPAPATTTNWTGFYSGPNAGGGFENTIKNSATTIPSLCDDPGMALCAALTAGVPGQFNTHPRGFIGGGQIGYNWQTGVFVWGVETDFQGANIQGDKSVANAQVVPSLIPSTVLPVLSSHRARAARRSAGSAPCEGDWAGRRLPRCSFTRPVA